MKNNISFNHTLEQYNKKYRNRKHRLLKLTKKEVEDFDKKNSTHIKGYLLKDRKWWLIKDTYYEIPKAPRYTWFRNLNAGIQAGCCLLGAGVIATAVTVPLVFMNKGGDTPQPAPEEEKVEVDSSLSNDFKITKVEKDKDGNTVISLENISGEKSPKEVEIYKGEQLLEEDVDYTIKIIETDEDIIINKESMDKYNGGIKLKSPYDHEFDGRVTEKEWKAAFTYVCKINDETNYSIYSIYDDENETKKSSLKVDNFTQMEEKSDSIKYQKLLSNGSIIQFDNIDGKIYKLLGKVNQKQYLSTTIGDTEMFIDFYNYFDFEESSKSYILTGEDLKIKFKKKNSEIKLDSILAGESYTKYKNYGTTKIGSMPDPVNFLEYSGSPSEGVYEFDKKHFEIGGTTYCFRINLKNVDFVKDKYISIGVPGNLMSIAGFCYVIDGNISDEASGANVYIPNSEFTTENKKDFTFILTGWNLGASGDYSCVLKVNQTKS